MGWWRAALVVIAGLLVGAALVPIGTRERTHDVASQVRGIRHVKAAVGRLDNPSFDAYRSSCLTAPSSDCPNLTFDCLVYGRGSNPTALELCVDPEGRIVEAMDRRFGKDRIWSVRYNYGLSPVRVDRAEVDALLRRAGAYEPSVSSASATRGPPGSRVTIRGSSIQNTYIVRFGGVPAVRVVVDSPTRVDAVVPPNAKSGPLVLITTSGPLQVIPRFEVTRS
jgi:hypothetical protein